LPTAKAENLANNTASSATQCRSSPVSGRYLPKREYFKEPPETFDDLGRKLSNWESGDRLLNRKSPPLAGFSAVLEADSHPTKLPGWQRSADRTRLHASSLLTGNFTGNFAISGLPRPILQQETAALQSFFGQFPTQINRENTSKNR